MAYDDQFLKAMRIKVEEDTITDTIAPACQHRQIRVMPCEEEPGHVMLSGEDFLTLMNANRDGGQRAVDLENTVQNWIARARENDQHARMWRNVALIIGVGVALIEGVNLWAWIR